MKSRLLLSLVATALSAMTAGAIQLPVNITDGGRSTVLPMQPNNNPTSNLNFLLAQIESYNANPNNAFDVPSLLSEPTAPQIAANFENLSGTTYTILPGYKYVVLKAGNSWEALYLGGYGGTVTSPNGKDFSSARYVPDGGSTVMLLGAALGVIAVARRKFGI
jgi:VPDSG-CTERM motif